MTMLCPQDIGIILTYRCQCACRHCLYSCGPQWEKEAASVDTLRQALESVLRFSRRPQVHLTGGEPFLHFELLVEGAAMASDLGIDCYVETSASWCKDENETLERFKELKEAGLKAVLVSCSPFHAERIAPARTLEAVRGALKVFGPGRTIVYLPDFIEVIQLFDADRPTPISRYEELFGREKAHLILWKGYGIISGGRSGYHLGHVVPCNPAEAFAGEDCSAEILHAHHSHFDLYGNYISGFCGGLTIGDWHDLGQILDDFEARRYPPLTAQLIEGGPFRLYDQARQQSGFRQRAEGYAGKCHLCVDVRRHLAQSGRYEELRPKKFYENLTPATKL